MPNPYEVTSNDLDPVDDSTSIGRAITFGVFGYFAPLMILFPMSAAIFGASAASDVFDRVVAIHGGLSFSRVAAMAPNIACMIFFGMAGYRRWMPAESGRCRFDPLSLGIATLVGYSAVMLATSLWIPLPWRWPSGLANGVRSGLVAIFPLCEFAFRWIRSTRFQPSAPE